VTGATGPIQAIAVTYSQGATGTTGSATVSGATGPTGTVNIVFPGPSSSSGGGGFNFTFNTSGVGASSTSGSPYLITGTGNQFIIFHDPCYTYDPNANNSSTYSTYLELPSASTANQIISLEGNCQFNTSNNVYSNGATVKANGTDKITDPNAAVFGASSVDIYVGAMFVSDGNGHWYALGPSS
jgi:hypothetical protein